MGRGEDRISYLPDSVLQSILTLMPLKSAIRTDILSKKWRNLWKCSLSKATALEFGEEFSNHLSAEQFVETVNRYLSLNESEKLERFHVFFFPFDLFLPHIEKWITFAVGKRVRNLNIDLSQAFTNPEKVEFTDNINPFELPSSLFHCDSLIDLRLHYCNFKTPLNVSNFGGLQYLSIWDSNISDDMLQSILSECLLLESLSLMCCHQLFQIRISGLDLILRRLTIGYCISLDLVMINAPQLQSFHYFGKLCHDTYIRGCSSLEDALIHSISGDPYIDLTTLLCDIFDVQILTLCEATLVHMNLWGPYAPLDERINFCSVKLRNLEELQLLMTSMADEDLKCFYTFFCSFITLSLEKLFIQLPKRIDDPNAEKHWWSVLNPPRDKITTLDHLKIIKVTNFKGIINEMRMVSFLLQKAPILETLVLVLPAVKKGNGKERLNLRVLKEQVLQLPKVSSTVQIILHEAGEDDGLNLNPTHMDIYNDYFC